LAERNIRTERSEFNEMEREEVRIERSKSKEMEKEDPKGLSKMYKRKSFDLSQRSEAAFTFLFEPGLPTPTTSPSGGIAKARTLPTARYFDIETYSRHATEVVSHIIQV
jgi:hypothetical protein